MQEQGAERSAALIPLLVRVIQKEWPDCRSFSGAVQKYLPDAVKLLNSETQRNTRREEELARRKQEQAEEARQREEQQRFRATWEPVWQALSEKDQEGIRQQVLARHPHLATTQALLEEQCLRELARRV
jgi:hypothetical protein